MKRFTGIYTPIVTPFQPDDSLDEAGLVRNVQRWMGTSLRVSRTRLNAEAAQLDDDEWIASSTSFASMCCRIARSSLEPVVNPRERRSRQRGAAAAGVDAVLVGRRHSSSRR